MKTGKKKKAEEAQKVIHRKSTWKIDIYLQSIKRVAKGKKKTTKLGLLLPPLPFDALCLLTVEHRGYLQLIVSWETGEFYKKALLWVF